MALALPSAAQTGTGGRLMVHPTRLVLDDALPRPGENPKSRGRSGEILLVNGGGERGTYRISLMNMEMGEDGGVREVPPRPGEVTAVNLIRFSPRQVTLEPATTQTVRIQVRIPEGLAPGEYRCHMLFRAVPEPAPAKAPVSGEEAEEQGFSVRLIPIYGLTVPIIIRHGATQVSASLSGLRLEAPAGTERPPALHLRLHRKGNKSVYGDLEATWSPKGGLSRAAGSRRGIAVYAKVAQRDLELALPDLPAGNRGPGTLKVRFLDHETKAVLSEAALEVAGTPTP